MAMVFHRGMGLLSGSMKDISSIQILSGIEIKVYLARSLDMCLELLFIKELTNKPLKLGKSLVKVEWFTMMEACLSAVLRMVFQLACVSLRASMTQLIVRDFLRVDQWLQNQFTKGSLSQKRSG
jgi:hypothetical protein